MSAIYFLVNSLFSLYIGIVILRIMLFMVGADFYNFIANAVLVVTNPPLKLMHRLIPYKAGARLDYAALLFAVVLCFTQLALLYQLTYGFTPALPDLLVRTFIVMVKTVINIYFYAIVAMVIMSWIMQDTYNSANIMLNQLTYPIINPVKRVIPPLGMIDISPMIVLLGLKFFELLLLETIAPLLNRLVA